MIQRIEFPTLVLHDITTDNGGYSVQSVSGLGEPVIRISQYDKPGEDGGVVASLLYGSRLVTISGRIDGADAATFEARRLAFSVATAPERDLVGRPAATQITITTLSGQTYYISGVVRKNLVEVANNSFANFMIEVVCPDAAIFGTDSISSGAFSRALTSGVAFPWIFDPTIEFGASTGGSAVVTNEGSASVWPILTLTGALTNPTIYHDETGTVMQLNLVTGVNDVIVIDMKEHTIVANGTTNYLSYKTTDSDWFSIRPGNNTIRLNTGSTGDTGTLEITFNPGYLAI